MMTPEQINAAVLGCAKQLDPALAEKLAAPPIKANGDTAQNGHMAPTSSEEFFRLTDYGNAERLVAQHGKDLRYCHDMKRWFCWDGTQWAPDPTAEVERRGKETIRGIYGEAANMDSADDRKAVADWARRSEKASQIQAMISLARSEQGIPVMPTQLDTNPWVLNVENGTIDLRTGNLLDHRREDLLTKLAPVVYDPAAKCPRWLRFLHEVFEPQPDLAAFMQRAAGYALTGDTREECLFLLHGIGRNGKGTFIRTLMMALGDYAATADFSTFVVSRSDDSRPRDDIANMQGKRFVAAQESKEGAAFAESIVKWVTGGDRVRARRLYENSFEFDPSHKIFLATNHKPVIRGTDTAIWERIKLVPFEISFAGREDKTLKAALVDELPGILAWSVEGCLRWQEEGLQPPEAVTSATRKYRIESDQVGRFIEECCLVGEYSSAKARPLYSAYRKWAEEAGETAVTEMNFLDQIGDRGFTKEHKRDGNVYSGIGLL